MQNPNYQPATTPLSDADRDLIAAIVVGKIAVEELFTAFDVTSAVRRSAVIPNARHWQVKGVVHDMFNQGQMGPDYTRTLQNVGAQEPAFVYHPYTVSSTNYGTVTVPTQPVVQVARPTVTLPGGRSTATRTMLSASPFGAIAGQVNTLKDGTAKSDSLGRILVPKKALAHIGATPKSQVWMTKNADGTIVITSGDVNPGGKPYSVDIYQNLKFTIGTNREFMIDGDTQRITLTPVSAP